MNKEYYELLNEGGEGYTPTDLNHTKKDITSSDILREIERKDSTIARESGTYNENEIKELKQKYEALKKQEEEIADKAFFMVWTKEETIKRRKGWNEWVIAQGANIPALKVNKKISEQGWGVETLRKAIDHYNL
jgi:hypothetical protein